MKVSLIGMSGIGKSHWSQKLEKLGWLKFCIDDLIEQKLEKELKSAGFRGIEEVALWMGMPFDNQYFKKSKKYLDFEKSTMEEVFDQISNLPSNKNVIIDTTGSVIYTGDKIMQTLSELTHIVHLGTTLDRQQEMFKMFLKEPKPVIWGKVFKKKKDENNTQALARCYPKLLKFRLKKYNKYADIEINYHEIRKPGFTVNDFLDLINKYS